MDNFLELSQYAWAVIGPLVIGLLAVYRMVLSMRKEAMQMKRDADDAKRRERERSLEQEIRERDRESEARRKAEQSFEKQREEVHEELRQLVHTWKNKFQSVQSQMDVQTAQRLLLEEKIKNLEQSNEAKDEQLGTYRRRIQELERHVEELQRRLSRYDPANNPNSEYRPDRKGSGGEFQVTVKDQADTGNKERS